MTQCLFLALGILTTASQLTIPELVARKPGEPIDLPWIVDAEALPLKRLASGAELIVVSRLENGRSYLAGNDLTIETEYELTPSRVLVDRAERVSTERPGSTPPLTLTLNGGEMTVSGTKVKVSNTTFAKWSPNADLLLFLIRQPNNPNAFWLVGGAAGAFEIDSTGRLKSLKARTPKAPDLEGVALDQVVSAIAKLSGGR